MPITPSKATVRTDGWLHSVQQDLHEVRMLASAISLGDIQKIAFKTRRALYEYLVLPFGVTAQFMGMMNDLLGESLDRFVLTFLDDILVYSRNIKEHDEYLWKVLSKL